MKEPIDYIEQNYLSPLLNDLPEDVRFLFLRSIKQAQNEAYNQAVDDVCQRARLKTVSSSGNINTTSQEFHAYNTVVSVDVDSLKRLKKSVVSTD